ncbi:MAG: hypothetical protein AB2813_02565, partial [Candidatus Sedimenticola endophacoides]
FIPAWGKDYFLLRIIICGSRGWRQRHWLILKLKPGDFRITIHHQAPLLDRGRIQPGWIA